jgi:ABC-type lipoprotein release transport system permease subunit
MGIPLKYNVRNLITRRATSLLTAAAVCIVVLIALTLASLIAGIHATIGRSAAGDNVLVLAKGALSMESSRLDRRLMGEVETIAEIKRDTSGAPLVSPELVVSDYVFYQRLGQSVSTTMRGVLPGALAVHGGAHLLTGRWPGTGEVLLGRKLAGHLGRANVGDAVRVGTNTWKVAGVLVADGSTLETEMWFDLNELTSAARREGISAIAFKVRDRDRLTEVAASLDADPRFGARFVPETQYFEEQNADTCAETIRSAA